MAKFRLNTGVPDDYEPSAGELDNLIYLVLKYTISGQMRQADKHVCLMMAGTTVRLCAGTSASPVCRAESDAELVTNEEFMDDRTE